jgi:pyruvate,water dikinase
MTGFGSDWPSPPTIRPTSGIPALDKILLGIRPGDNVVWQVLTVEDYAELAEPFWKAALARDEQVVYFRFAQHAELVPLDSGAARVELDPERGFERFITAIHRVIAELGPRANYVFDMFSELVRDWYSERMLGNFFMLTCPYLYALDTVAYFAVLRNYHSYHAIQPIAETAQLLIRVHRYQGKIYIHPLKVDQRYSPTMHMIHAWEDDQFTPVTDSATTAEIVNSTRWPGLKSASYRMIGMWDRRFMQAEETLAAHAAGSVPTQTIHETFDRVVTRILSRDERVVPLLRQYVTLQDIVDVWKRVVGSGMVGGKTVGLLLARAILKQSSPKWEQLLEPHDSFFVGSDIFYMYLVQNDCWWIRQKQKSPSTLLDEIGEARRRILKGDFPDYLVKRFADMLDYFGQSPIIVRSSSLLEDAFGNAFAGKYESIFCPNQGTHQQRLEELLGAIRFVYASAMSEEALTYRAKRGVLDRDEQMALLVQRVSGMQYGEVFYPQLAGVGFSVNPFVWHHDIDPEAGVLRLVFGLGTRAVDRSDDDYTRVVALNVPFKRPQVSEAEVRHYSQRRVDYLDLKRNRFTSGYFQDVVARSPGLEPHVFGYQDRGLERRRRTTPWLINLDQTLERIPLADDMREMLRTLREAYGCHVDIEFTANLRADGSYKINLLQCRPLQIKECDLDVSVRPRVASQNVIMEAHGAVLGYQRMLDISRLIYVVPSAYGHLPTQQRHSVARLIGRLTHVDDAGKNGRIMLLGPGRWGTKMPELGVPVAFGEINTVAVLCEIDAMHEGLTPDLSLGTHFFHELVEMNMNEEYLAQAPNLLGELLPDEAGWANVVRVLCPPAGRRLVLSADHMEQKALLFLAAE